MSRRRRILLALLVILMLPVLAVIGVGGYLSQGLENELSQRWAKRGLPGQLSAARVRFTGLDEVVAEGLALGEAGKPALVTAGRAVARIDLVERRLISLRFEGVQGELDADRLAYLRAIIEAESHRPPEGLPQPVRVEVLGVLRLPGGLTCDKVSVTVDAVGAEATAEADAIADGRPLQLTVNTHRARPDGPIVTTISILKAHIGVLKAVDALEGLFPIGHAPQAVRALLPPDADASGTNFSVDPANEAAHGQVRLSWSEGTISADLNMDRRYAWLHKLDLRHGRLGSLQGELQIDRRTRAVILDASAWQPGKDLPVPPRVPITEIARLLPTMSIRHPFADGRTQIVLLGVGNARVEVLLGGDAPPRLSGANIPLALVQPLLPEPLVLAGGQVEALTATLHADRPELEARLIQARLLAAGWSFGPLDGRLAAVAMPGGGVQVSAVLPRAGSAEKDAPPMGTIAFAGTAERGTLSVECTAVESLLTRLRGPSPLPDLRGGLQLAMAYTRVESGLNLKLDRLGLSGVEMRLSGAELVRSVDGILRGEVQVRPQQVVVRAGGQLKRGELRVAGSWINIAAQQPICTTEVRIHLGSGGELASLQLVEALVRAADAAGTPLPGGYSAQFAGALAGTPLEGSLDGVLDHADLRWITGLTGASEAQIAGEGAVTVSARLGLKGLSRISGTFLPLGVDIDLLGGKLKIHGISGGIRFAAGEE